MRISGQFQACLFIYLFVFFYEKVLSVKKHSPAKINQQNKNKRTEKEQMQYFLYVQKLLRGWRLFVLHVGPFLALKTFS